MHKNKILREPEVLDRVGCSSPTLRRLEHKGQFPRRIKIGARAVGWLESEILEWFANRSSKGERNASR